MTPPDAFVSGIADLLAVWGFTGDSPLEGVRSLHRCRQRLECHIRQRQHADVWNVTLIASSSFSVDLSIDEHVWSFRTSPHLLDRNRRVHWTLRPHKVDTVLKALNREYYESFQPFLRATSTPAPSILQPVRRALEVVTLLPIEEQGAGRKALQRKLEALKAWHAARQVR
ncbi:hypothetical protein [Deinococcus alpinitundrae]|uniref:hypothetical protein n=1 Tax=Deinococcus alpinitundrae TaxID=468913 RepID=UPI00137A11E0|nr:hypothetical protein [Deinococcus alpinitundrae]